MVYLTKARKSIMYQTRLEKRSHTSTSPTNPGRTKVKGRNSDMCDMVYFTWRALSMEHYSSWLTRSGLGINKVSWWVHNPYNTTPTALTENTELSEVAENRKMKEGPCAFLERPAWVVLWLSYLFILFEYFPSANLNVWITVPSNFYSIF